MGRELSSAIQLEVEVLKRCPGSVIEIGIKEVDDMFYFHRFFCSIKPCIEGFLKDAGHTLA